MASEHFFYGNPIGYGTNGFIVIQPGQTVDGSFFCIGPLAKAVIIQTPESNWGGDLNGQTIRVSVFGSFSSITVDGTSPGNLIAYRY
jgi:hypothetical protein